MISKREMLSNFCSAHQAVHQAHQVLLAHRVHQVLLVHRALLAHQVHQAHQVLLVRQALQVHLVHRALLVHQVHHHHQAAVQAHHRHRHQAVLAGSSGINSQEYIFI